MLTNWTNTKIWLLSVLLVTCLAGCSTSKEKLLPHGNEDMLDVWNQGTGGSSSGGQQAQQLMDARQLLRRPLVEGDNTLLAANQMNYSRHAQNEIYSQFKRLPNPDLVMYVFPHLSGTEPVPVPGYTTVFPLYQRVRYALPGERVEPY